MPHLASVPRFTMPTDTDDATRRDQLLAHHGAQAEEHLAKLDDVLHGSAQSTPRRSDRPMT